MLLTVIACLYPVIMALVCCSFFSGLGWCYPELQGIQCSLVDRDPGTEARPVMTHDPELSCDGLQLWPRGMFYFYCELFHFFFSGSISFFTSRRISSIASAILFNCFSFITVSYYIPELLSSLLLACCWLFFFLGQAKTHYRMIYIT